MLVLYRLGAIFDNMRSYCAYRAVYSFSKINFWVLIYTQIYFHPKPNKNYLLKQKLQPMCIKTLFSFTFSIFLCFSQTPGPVHPSSGLWFPAPLCHHSHSKNKCVCVFAECLLSVSFRMSQSLRDAQEILIHVE